MTPPRRRDRTFAPSNRRFWCDACFEGGDDGLLEFIGLPSERWTREGREVRVARPPRGHDFADVLAGDIAVSGMGVAA